MKTLAAIWAKEPLVILSLLAAIIGVLVAFHVHIDETQKEAIRALVLAAGVLVARSMVSPTGSSGDTKPPTVPPLPIIGIVFALLLSGCSGSLRNGVVASVNAAADFGTGAERVLADLDRTEQQACVDENSTPELRRACALAVRVRFHEAWSAYREYKLAWVASAATVHAYDAGLVAARAPDVVALLKAAGSLADAAEKLRAAVDGLRELVAPPGSANAEKIGGLS
jgi:hypothetical protein